MVAFRTNIHFSHTFSLPMTADFALAGTGKTPIIREVKSSFDEKSQYSDRGTSWAELGLSPGQDS